MKHYTDVASEEIVINRVNTLGYVECDECEKRIMPCEYMDDHVEASAYIRVHTWHNDWGNDSIDSHDYLDLCPECAAKFVSSHILEMYDTMHLECNIEYARFSDKRRTVVLKEELRKENNHA